MTRIEGMKSEGDTNSLWSPPARFNSRWAIWKRETGGGRHDVYVTWISQRWREFDAINGGTPTRRSAENHDAFDEWLLERARMTGAIPGEGPIGVGPPLTDFWCALGPTGIVDQAAIYLDDAAGGDPHIICTLDRVYHAEHLKELCRLASWVLSGGKNG